MSRVLKAFLGFGLAAIAAGQGLVTQRNLSLPMAKAIAEAALAACKAKGYNTSVAVVDRAGQVLVILRDEEATAQTAEMARRHVPQHHSRVSEAHHRSGQRRSARRGRHPRTRRRRAHPGGK
jgi:hypothetical protein